MPTPHSSGPVLARTSIRSSDLPSCQSHHLADVSSQPRHARPGSRWPNVCVKSCVSPFWAHKARRFKQVPSHKGDRSFEACAVQVRLCRSSRYINGDNIAGMWRLTGRSPCICGPHVSRSHSTTFRAPAIDRTGIHNDSTGPFEKLKTRTIVCCYREPSRYGFDERIASAFLPSVGSCVVCRASLL